MTRWPISWKAIYNDGKEFPQFNEDGTENKYPDIERNKLEKFNIYKDDKLIFVLHLEGSRRLICRFRVEQKLISGTKNLRLLMVGWQQTIKGENIQDLAYIFEDGHIELAGKWKEGDRIFYAPNLIEDEKQIRQVKSLKIDAKLIKREAEKND